MFFVKLFVIVLNVFWLSFLTYRWMGRSSWIKKTLDPMRSFPVIILATISLLVFMFYPSLYLVLLAIIFIIIFIYDLVVNFAWKDLNYFTKVMATELMRGAKTLPITKWVFHHVYVIKMGRGLLR